MDSEILAHLKSSRLLWETFVSNFSHMKVVRKPWKSFHQAWRRRIWAVSRIILYIPDICQTPQTYLCKFLPGVNFYWINEKNLAFWQSYADKWHFYRFNSKSWRFWYKYIVYYVLLCWFIVFYCAYVYGHLVLLCLLCWSIVLIVLSNHTLVNFSQEKPFLERKSRMTLLISDKVVCNIVRTKVIEMFSHMQGGRKRVQHCKESLVGQCQARWRMSGPNRHNLQSEEDLNILL